MSEVKEQWLDIAGYEGLYQVSNLLTFIVACVIYAIKQKNSIDLEEEYLEEEYREKEDNADG